MRGASWEEEQLSVKKGALRLQTSFWTMVKCSRVHNQLVNNKKGSKNDVRIAEFVIQQLVV